MYKLIDLPKLLDSRGNLTFVQCPDQIPFKIQRVFWTYGVPGGESRGGHAYKTQEELIIALSGSFDVLISNSDGTNRLVNLNRSYFGLYLPPNTWRQMINFSTNAIGLHLSSNKFDETDYIRDLRVIQNAQDYSIRL